MHDEPLILCVGGADTGRAPMAAALLRRRIETASLHARVESAGVLGHDGAPAQPEARDALAAFGLDLSSHVARSLDNTLAQQAALLLTLDSGTLLVLRARYGSDGNPITRLAELAGRERDIPDPFRMQVGAWLTYAREIDAMLEAALPQLVQLAGLTHRILPSESRPVATNPEADPHALDVLLAGLEVHASLFDWPRTRAYLDTTLGAAAAGPLGTPYLALLRALLAVTAQAPQPQQVRQLREAVQALRSGPTQDDLTALSALMPAWAAAGEGAPR